MLQIFFVVCNECISGVPRHFSIYNYNFEEEHFNLVNFRNHFMSSFCADFLEPQKIKSKLNNRKAACLTFEEKSFGKQIWKAACFFIRVEGKPLNVITGYCY
jgi:hypothetical protein